MLSLWISSLGSSALVGCGPNLLPNNNFGSAGDGQDDAQGPGSDAGLGDDGSSSGADGPGTAGSSSDGGSSDSGSGDGSGSSDGGSGNNDGIDRGSDTMTGDGPSSDGMDGVDGMDTWGIPPDVTNEPCNPLAQDCFPTHKCVPYATVEGSPFLDADKCMPILGDKSWGQPCTLSGWSEAQDDCDGEGFCWNLHWIEGQLQGTCVPFCVGSPQNLMCPAGWNCLFSGAIALCSKQCDPLMQDCPLDYGCYWTGNAFDCSLVGTPAGDLESCDMHNDCLPGFACVGKALVPTCTGGDPNCCTPWCDVTAPDSCQAPRSCVAFFDEGQAPPGYADVGLCVI